MDPWLLSTMLIQEFEIQGNNIGGSIPDIISALKDLEVFKLNRNSISGKLDIKLMAQI